MTTPILAVNALNAFIHAYSSWKWAFLVCQKVILRGIVLPSMK